jgi:DNA topoisomerase-1
LQTSAASRYKFPAAKTMKLAQSLYEAGLITYMRTDSCRLSPEAVTECRNYLTKQSYDIPTSPNLYSSKGGAQDAHEAIRPSDVLKLPTNVFLGDDEQKIYQLIWERFVASQMNPALYDTVNMTIKTSNGHILKANGKTLKYKGWLEVTKDIDSNDDNDTKLPILNVGDKLVLVPPKVRAEKKATQPPPRYSEKSLIEELEKRGIGRPSTYAAIMSKITDRNYVTRKVNVFIPTDLGKKVVDNLVKHFDFVEYKYTADMELQLDKIADGKSDYLTTMQNFYTPFALQLKKAYLTNIKDYGFACEKCQNKMELKHGQFGFYMACVDRPNCRNTFSCDMIDEKPVKRENKLVIADGITCPKCESQMAKKDGKFGPFYSCMSPKCHGTRKVPFGKKCSDCNGELYATIYCGENVLFCMNYPKCFHKEKLNKYIPDPRKI